MAVHYTDTSALVKRYALEVGTTWVTLITDPASGHEIWTVRVTGPELIAALGRKVRMGEITAADAAQAMSDFRTDWRAQYQIVEIDAPLADAAMDLADRHGLRGYDAVHLAAALRMQRLRGTAGLPALTFVTADLVQERAAQAEGLTTDNPLGHP